MISITTLQKFKSSPGTMSNNELKEVKAFLKKFKEYHSRYTEAGCIADDTGVCYNEIQRHLDRAYGYLNFKGANE